jgi:hypothetical protein
VQKKNNFSNSHGKKKNNNPENVAKTKQTTTFKKKKNDGNCYVCSQSGHFAGKRPDRKGAGKTSYMVIGEIVVGTSG